ncbi:hypothetical protein G7054_g80 [Neopestalotiopsis clavispora]|nr:hypothetical protein G7054_g80 [Neopestalotiopsis clavispora]
MCRRVFYHHMHCDVRQQMTVPNGMTGAEAGVYENPLRTFHHRCEVDIRVHEPVHSVLLDLPAVKCEYHSCCLVVEEILYCFEGDEALDDGEEFEPEMCDCYALEHRHEQIYQRCFGDACQGWLCVHNLTNGPVGTKKQWPELEEVIWYETWDPVYARPAELRAKWEDRLFRRMAKLTTLNNDLLIHAAVLHDISGGAALENTRNIEAAAKSFLRCNRKVTKQKRRIERRFKWAQGRD